MATLDVFFSKMSENQRFSENVINSIYKSLSVDGEHIEVGMLLGHLQSLQGYYSIIRKMPYVANHIHYPELVEIIKSKIRIMETYTVMTYILDNINKFDEDEINLT